MFNFSKAVQLNCLFVGLFVCIICFETFHGPLEGINLVFLTHKIVSTPATLPRGAVLSYLLPIFVYRYFFDALYFLRTIQLLHIIFLQMFLVLLTGLPQ